MPNEDTDFLSEEVFRKDYNGRHGTSRQLMADRPEELYEYLWDELLHYVPTKALDAMLADDPKEDGFLQFVARRMTKAYRS